MKKRILSMLLVLTMLLSLMPTAVFANTDAVEESLDSRIDVDGNGTVNYVSFGASNVNGFGLYGYLPPVVYEYPDQKDQFNIYGYKIQPEGSYPDLLVEYFESKGYTVEIDQLAMSSMRAEEVRMMFDDTYNGDAYTEWRFTGGEQWFYGAGKLAYAELNGIEVTDHSDSALDDVSFDEALAALRQVYQNDVANADIITWDVGINNFGVYLSGRVVDGDYNDPIESISPEAADYYAQVKAYLFDMVKAEYGEEMLNNLLSMNAEHIMDSLAYCLVAYCVNYDIAMEKIYALNPDVTVVNVSIQNLMKGLVAEIPGIEGQIPLGDIVALVINAANTYMAEYSPYADKGYYANVSEDQHVTFFIDQLADYNGDPTTLDQDMIDCWRVYHYGGNMLAAFEPFVFENGKMVDPETTINMGYGVVDLYGVQLVAIDTIAKYLKSAAELNVIHFDVLAGGDWGRVSDTGMDAIVNAVTEQVSAYYEHALGGKAYEEFDRVEVADDCWTTLANENDIDVDLMDTFAAYGVRTFIGNAFYAHPNRVGLQEIRDIIVEALEEEITGEQVFNGNTDETLQDFYYFLKDDESMNTAEKVDLLEKIYSVMEGSGSLSDYPEVAVVKEIYDYLTEEEYITDEQTLAIVLFVYIRLPDKDLSAGEAKDIAQFVYETLLYNKELYNADRVDIVYNVYTIVKDDYLTDYADYLTVVEAICARPEMAKVTDAQTWAIIDCIYQAVKSGNVNARAIAKTIYFDILTVKAASAAVAGNGASGSSSSGSATELTAGDKLDIIMAVYEVLVEEDMLDETTDLKAVKDLYVTLTTEENGAQLVSDELALSIFDLVFETLVEDEDIDDEDIAGVATQVVDKLLGEESELSPEAKAAVLEKVTDALKDTSFAGSVGGGMAGPALEVIDALKAKLKAAEYLTDAEIGKIIESVYAILKTEDEEIKAQKADEIYTILLNKEGMTAEDRIVVLTIIYETLDEYGYVDGALALAFLKAYTAAKDNGYIDAAVFGLGVAKDALGEAYDYVNDYKVPNKLKPAKELLLAELESTAATIGKLEELMGKDFLDAATWAELMALEGELTKHADTLAELALAVGVVIDPYIIKLNDAVVDYAVLVDTIAKDAYAIAVETVEGFVDAYAAWVESVGAAVDAISPELGAAVRKFLTEVPADSLAILYAYGEEAVVKLVTEAVATYGDVAEVVAGLAYVLYEHGDKIYEAVKDNQDVQDLIVEIKDQLDKAAELAEWINDHPFEGAYNASQIKKEEALQAAYAELVYLYNRLYDVTMSAVATVDPIAAEALAEALDALAEALGITCDAAEGYLGWLADHTEAMGAALLAALLDNVDELLSTACPIIDQMIWDLIAQIEAAIPGIIEYLVDALIAFLPIADQWMYDWLYNHPYEVIAFFTEYGDEIAALAEEYGSYVVGILAYIAYTYGPEVLEFIIENPCEALDMFVNWYNKYGYRIWPMIDVYLEALGVYDAIEDAVNGELEKLNDLLNQINAEILEQIAALQAQIEALKEALKDAEGELREQILAEIAALEEAVEQMINELMAALKSFLQANISANYVVGPNSYYVALGDAGAYGPAADLLAAELGMTKKYANLTIENATSGDVLAALNADEIAKADLITLGFGATPIIDAVIADVANAAFGEVSEKDWAALVGAEGAAAIAAALVELGEYVMEQTGDEMIAALLPLAVESLAYVYINHLVDYVVVSEAIHEINAEALLVLVGMHNPLDGVVFEMGEEKLDLGEYVDYLVTLTNIYSFGYALFAENTIYVDAPDVEVDAETMLPTEAGYEYIQEQIYNALNPTLAEEEEHVHTGTVIFTWAPDNSTCKAAYVCSVCGLTETKDCLVEVEITKQPTVEEAGEAKYTASVEFFGTTYSESKTVELPKLPAPDTGDTAMVGLYVTMMLMASAAAVVVLKKKKNA